MSKFLSKVSGPFQMKRRTMEEGDKNEADKNVSDDTSDKAQSNQEAPSVVGGSSDEVPPVPPGMPKPMWANRAASDAQGDALPPGMPKLERAIKKASRI